MIDLLQRLEPIRFDKDFVIFTELDDVNEVLFI